MGRGTVVQRGAEADSLVRFEVKDNNTAGTSAHWWNGSALAAGSTVTLNTGDLSSVWVRSGARRGGKERRHRGGERQRDWSGGRDYRRVTAPQVRARVR